MHETDYVFGVNNSFSPKYPVYNYPAPSKIMNSLGNNLSGFNRRVNFQLNFLSSRATQWKFIGTTCLIRSIHNKIHQQVKSYVQVSVYVWYNLLTDFYYFICMIIYTFGLYSQTYKYTFHDKRSVHFVIPS